MPELREASPETGIVVLTMESEPAFAREALQRGRARLRAQGGGRRGARQRGAAGRRRAAPTCSPSSAPGSPPTRREDADGLSERELEILRLIALGHTNSEIAEQLFLSVRTVESHRSHIQQKLRMTKRSELVRYALGRGLLGTAQPSEPSSGRSAASIGDGENARDAVTSGPPSARPAPSTARSSRSR